MPVATVITRREEITTDFLRLVDEHIIQLMDGKVTSRFSAADFAKLLFVHPRHLSNTLKETTGKSPCDFMEERILLEAQKMLKETNLSIADISEKFGYKDATNFTKFFKGMANITPLQYRKSLKFN